MKRLTVSERNYIEYLYKKGHNPYQISKIMGKHNSVIYYELKKGYVELLNSDLTTKKVYLSDTAQRVTEERKHNIYHDLAIGNNIALSDRIEELIINDRRSPYQALRICENEGLNVNICLSTLYNYIYKGGVFYKLNKKHLIYKKRLNHSRQNEKRRSYKNLRGTSIDVRPKGINKRENFGHWELDSVVGKQGTETSLLVFTERLTRYELIYKVPEKTIFNTISILDKLEQQFKSDFPHLFKSITCDNGTEFLGFEQMQQSCINAEAERTTVYYCHPYCSSERGSNENANRIIRRFIPKGTDISIYSDDYIQSIQTYMNTMPRKIFDGKSSMQLANEYGFV